MSRKINIIELEAYVNIFYRQCFLRISRPGPGIGRGRTPRLIPCGGGAPLGGRPRRVWKRAIATGTEKGIVDGVVCIVIICDIKLSFSTHN